MFEINALIYLIVSLDNFRSIDLKVNSFWNAFFFTRPHTNVSLNFRMILRTGVTSAHKQVKIKDFILRSTQCTVFVIWAISSLFPLFWINLKIKKTDENYHYAWAMGFSTTTKYSKFNWLIKKHNMNRRCKAVILWRKTTFQFQRFCYSSNIWRAMNLTIIIALLYNVEQQCNKEVG